MPSVLNTDKFELTDSVSLYPNPSANYFTISGNMSKVEVYSITGQLVATFGSQSLDYQYNVSQLKSGVYLVKATDNNNRTKTMRLIKE